jgi:glycogen(starch) synthase
VKPNVFAPRIVIITSTFHPSIGGVEVIADTLAGTLAVRGCDVVVITRRAKSEINELSRPYKVRRVVKWRRAWSEIQSADLIIALGPVIEPLSYARLMRRPIIVSHHIAPSSGVIRSWFKNRFFSLLARRVVETACSKSLATALRRPAVVVPNPLRYDFRRVERDRFRGSSILFCGRLIPGKGLELLIDAFARVIDRQPGAALTIIGEGPLRGMLHRRVQTLGLESRVAIIPSRSGVELQKLFCQHAVIVVPSICEESFGLVALEALASGCRVVVSDRGGLPEAVGKSGIIVPPTLEALSEALNTALVAAEFPMSGEELKAVQRHLDEHTPERFVETILGLASGCWPHLAIVLGKAEH